MDKINTSIYTEVENKNNSSLLNKKKLNTIKLSGYVTSFLASSLSNNTSALEIKDRYCDDIYSSSTNKSYFGVKNNHPNFDEQKKDLNSLYSGERIYNAPK